MKWLTRFSWGLLVSFFFLFNFSLWAEELQQIPSAVHIHTQWSSGKFSAEEIIQLAKEKEIPILFFTDSALRRWEYTLFHHGVQTIPFT